MEKRALHLGIRTGDKSGKYEIQDPNSNTKPTTYLGLVAKQFKRNKLATIGLAVVGLLAAVAILADFIANDRPLFMVYEGKPYFPVVRGMLVDAGVAEWQPQFRNKKFKKLVEMDAGRAGAESTPPSPPLHMEGGDSNASVKPLQIEGGNGARSSGGDVKTGGDAGATGRKLVGWVVFPPIPFSPNDFDLNSVITPPSFRHWLGTDDTGRDLASKLIHGTRISLSIGIVAVSIYITIGVLLGSLAGYFGGWVDVLISRMIELMICFPVFFLIIAIVAYLPQSIYNIMIVIGITGWAGVARLVRGEFLRLRNIDYVQAARALGFGPGRIIFRHILPNALAPVFVSATFGVAVAILTESSLSFLGFGVPPTTASWGSVLAKAREILPAGWWLTTFPGLAIFLTVTVLNLVGEGLRDAMDPRLARR